MTTNAKTCDIVIVGAGAAGLLAGASTPKGGGSVLLLEKNSKAGVKILMSGGTRCNITHATDRRGVIEAFRRQGKFLHSALAALGPDDVVNMVEAEGVATKVEDTGKVFPVSNSAVDVRDALLRIFRRNGGQLCLGEAVGAIERDGLGFRVITESRSIPCRKVVLTSGGMSYPGCGTTGDGYAWAKALGHRIVDPRPALVPLNTRSAWVPTLTGITVPDVRVAVLHEPGRSSGSDGKHIGELGKKTKSLAERRSSMLFTHFGLSGPAAMDVSHAITRHGDPRTLRLVCDFAPSMSPAELDADFQVELNKTGRRGLSVAVSRYVPRRLAESLLEQSCVLADRRAAELTKVERVDILRLIKETSIPLLGTLGFKKAEVTTGGVALDEIDSRTMESKIVPGLYFAGEILDLDGPIGGFNFQAAFSTGWLAGLSAGNG